MSVVEKWLQHNQFVLVSEDLIFLEPYLRQDVLGVASPEQLDQVSSSSVMAIDHRFLTRFSSYKKNPPPTDHLILIYTDKAEKIKPLDYKNWNFKSFTHINEFNMETFLAADKQVQEDKQKKAFLELSDQLNIEYEKIKTDLERKIQFKKKHLMESRQKILDSNNRTEAMRKILFSLFQEFDLSRIETTLNELLPSSSKAVWIKIIPKTQTRDFEKELGLHLNTTFKSHPLPDHEIFFIKADQKIFKKEDLDLFAKIKDAIEINYYRESDYKNLSLTQKIVAEAFEKFNHPLLIINSDYTIIEKNSAADKENSYPGKPSSKCFELLFGRSSPCVGCSLGKRFGVEKSGRVFDVFSNKMTSSQQDPLWVNLYLDKTEEHYFETRIRENAKMKELGIISSSIAHELNNPIGGLNSYLQLMAMDLPKDHAYQENIRLMNETSLRIKKIIEDLLIFSRKPKFDDQSNIVIAEAIKESLSQHEIQFKTNNIRVVNHSELATNQVKLSSSAFRDSLHFIFNFFIEKIAQVRKSKSSFTGLIEVKFTQDQVNYSLEIQSNCGPVNETEKAKDISLLALNKIISDQNLNMKISEPNENWISFNVVIPKS